MKKLFILLMVLGAVHSQAVFADEPGVVDKLGKGLEKGGKAAERGIEKGASAAGRGIEKGANVVGQGGKKIGEWIEKKTGKDGAK